MGRFIVKLTDEKTNQDYYMEWSTIVDAPVTYGLELEEFKGYYLEKYGRHGFKDLDDRLERAEKFGTSAHPPFNDLNSYFRNNHAGENGICLDREGILENYCRNRK